MRVRASRWRFGHLCVEGDEDGLVHPLVEGCDVIAAEGLSPTTFAGIVEGSDDGRVATCKDLNDTCQPASVVT